MKLATKEGNPSMSLTIVSVHQQFQELELVSLITVFPKSSQNSKRVRMMMLEVQFEMGRDMETSQF